MINLIEQASAYIDMLYQTSLNHLNQNPIYSAYLYAFKDKALRELHAKFDCQSTIISPFLPLSDHHTQIFLKNYDAIGNFLKAYTLHICQIADCSPQKLYHSNQAQLSKFRAINTVTFGIQDKNQQPLEYLLSYKPALKTANKQWYLTSHGRCDYQLDNANLLQVTLESKSDNTLSYSTFSGPASRVPYKSFNNANAYQRLLLLAITLKNQQQLIEIFKHHQPQANKIIEQYTQLISANSQCDDDFEKEQFEYTALALELLEDNHSFEHRHGCWGVNQKRNIDLNSEIGAKIETHNRICLARLFIDVIHLMPKSPLLSKALADDLKTILAALAHQQALLLPDKQHLTALLLNYHQEYAEHLTQDREKNDDGLVCDKAVEPRLLKLDKDFNALQSKLADFEKDQQKINALYLQLYHLMNHHLTTNKLSLLKQLQATDNKKLANCMMLLINAFELQTNQNWAKPENNFKIQTVISSLGHELGHVSTKGCKSNNNRGQRLMQKLLGFWLSAQHYHDGCYDMSYFDGNHQSLLLPFDAAHLTIQAQHHQANLGVGGGKYKLQQTDNFSDNGLWAKVAKWAKIYKMMPSTAPQFLNQHQANINLLYGAGAALFISTIPVIITPTLPSIALSAALIIVSAALLLLGLTPPSIELHDLALSSQI